MPANVMQERNFEIIDKLVNVVFSSSGIVANGEREREIAKF